MCKGCGHAGYETVFVMDPVPLAGAFAASQEEALSSRRYPLEWRRCTRCGLVNTWPDIDPALIFDSYSYHASDVPALRRHHADFADWLKQDFDPLFHIEIGGNDGVLTRHLSWRTFNIDPSDAWVGPGVNAPFTSALARTLPKADLVTSSNAFAHFPGIGDALDGVRHVLTRDGVFVMEVHDLDATLRGEQWDTVYHEHACEWDEDSLRNVGRLHGLRLEHVWRLPLHGGILRALFRPSIPRDPSDVPARDFTGLQRAYDTASAPPLPPGSIAYGAAARATVYLDHVRPSVDYVVDGSPRRAGRWVPGVGLPIKPPEDFGSPPAVLITARSHERDIMARHPDYAGEWVTTSGKAPR